MSGYLTNLLARSFNPSTPVVQPRLNSLFAVPEKNPTLRDSPYSVAEMESLDEAAISNERVPAADSSLSRIPTAKSTSPNKPESARARAPMNGSNLPEMTRNQVVREQDGRAQVSLVEAIEQPEVRHRKSNRKSGFTKVAHAHVRNETNTPDDVARIVPEKGAISDEHQQPSSIRANAKKSKLGLNASQTNEGQTLSESQTSLPTQQISRPQTGNLTERESASKAAPPAQRKEDSALSPLIDSKPLLGKIEPRHVVPAFPVSPIESHENGISARLSSRESNNTNAMTGSEFSDAMLGRLSHSVRNADLLSRRESQQPAVSTIEVTIGRIEVRGPAAPESRRVISQPAQAATLDEYLRRRSGQSRQ